VLPLFEQQEILAGTLLNQSHQQTPKKAFISLPMQSSQAPRCVLKRLSTKLHAEIGLAVVLSLCMHSAHIHSHSHLDWCTHSNFPVPTSPALKESSTHRPKVVRSRVESRSHRNEYYPDTNTNTNTFIIYPTLSARPPLRRLGFRTTLGGPRRQVHGAICTSTPRDCQNHHC
jgi:hypothetical protein